MREITPENAADYLRETGRVAPGRAFTVRALGWGVSNVVMRVDVEGEPPFVLKQARERLRTKAHWVSRLDRVWTERAALDVLAEVLPEGTVPRVLFSDEPNYLFAMTCAPDGSAVWKERLLAGETDPAVARRAGDLLATAHGATVGHPALDGPLADTAVFDQLRIDPFYRAVARVHPEVAPVVAELTASLSALPAGRRCLVLGDFSPKNVLIHPARQDDGDPPGLTLVDFETAHAGDPAYDLGFFLSHLLLKALRAARRPGGGAPPYVGLIEAFRAAYEERSEAAGAEYPGVGTDPGLDRRAAGHAAACLLARVDGKSPVDYLGEPERDVARRFALEALLNPASGCGALTARAARDVLG